MNPAYVSKVASKWFWDKETAVTGYGNLHGNVVSAHYNRTFKRATLGEYSQVAVHFVYWLYDQRFRIIKVYLIKKNVQFRGEIFYKGG